VSLANEIAFTGSELQYHYRVQAHVTPAQNNSDNQSHLAPTNKSTEIHKLLFILDYFCHPVKAHAVQK
jgi:hypothetical protein